MQLGNSNIYISKMLCVPTDRVYEEIYQRSFSLGLNPGNTSSMQDFFYTQGVQNNAPISMTAAAKSLGSSVRLSAVPTGKVYIPNGWSTQRLMFLLAVEEIINDSTALTHYIQGYSEYYDPSHAGKLDPNASYYINSITTVVRTKNMLTNSIDSRVSETYNVVFDPTGNSSYEMVASPGAGLELIRPTDIMANLHANIMYSGMEDVNLNVKTTSITNGANVSSRSNNDPLKYFTNTVNAVVNSRSVDIGHNTPESVLANANGIVSEKSITSNGFVYELSRLTGVMEPNSFTLGVLERIDPSTSSKVVLAATGSMLRDPNQMATVLDTNNTESMLNYTEESEVAQTFINALSSAMSENLVTVLSGTITNLYAEPITTISNINSFLEGVDVTPYGNRLINYVNYVIMPQLSVNGLRGVSIVFDCDLLGDTTVNVSLDNATPVTFRLPSFADSLYSPVRTDGQNKSAVVGDFELVVDSVLGMSSTDQTVGYPVNGY